MSDTDLEVTITPPGLDEAPPIVHLYPAKFGKPAPIGAVARCGHVKRAHRPWINADACPECVVCADLSRAAGRYPKRRA